MTIPVTVIIVYSSPTQIAGIPGIAYYLRQRQHRHHNHHHHHHSRQQQHHHHTATIAMITGKISMAAAQVSPSWSHNRHRGNTCSDSDIGNKQE